MKLKNVQLVKLTGTSDEEKLTIIKMSNQKYCRVQNQKHPGINIYKTKDVGSILTSTLVLISIRGSVIFSSFIARTHCFVTRQGQLQYNA